MIRPSPFFGQPASLACTGGGLPRSRERYLERLLSCAVERCQTTERMTGEVGPPQCKVRCCWIGILAVTCFKLFPAEGVLGLLQFEGVKVLAMYPSMRRRPVRAGAKST